MCRKKQFLGSELKRQSFSSESFPGRAAMLRGNAGEWLLACPLPIDVLC